MAEPSKSTSAWYLLGVLILIYASQHLDRMLVSVLLQPIKQEFLLSDTQVGLLTGLAFGVPYGIVLLPIGALIDRVNRRNLLAFMVMAWSGVTLATGFSANFLSLVIARSAVAATEAPNVPTSLSMLADRFDRTRRATAVGIYYIGPSIGTLLGFALGGLVAAHYGWRVAFFAGSIPGIVLAMVLLTTVREPVREPHPVTGDKRDAPSLGRTFAFIWSQRSLVHLTAAIMLASLTVSGQTVWMAAFLTRVHGMSLQMAGLAVGVGFSITAGLGQAMGGAVTDRLARVNVAWMAWFLAASTSVTCLLMLGSVLVGNAPLSVALIALWGLLNGMQYGPVLGTAAGLVHPRMRGTTSALLLLLMNLVGAGLGPQMVGMLSDFYAHWSAGQSLRWALVTVSFVEIWAAAHFLLAARTLRADLERTAPAGSVAV